MKFASTILFVITAALGYSQQILLPNKADSVKFLVFGDTGTGDRDQIEVGQRAFQYRQVFPFEFAVMLGDNMYGGERQKDYEKKFERPYQQLLQAGVKFHAALGNHDNPNQRYYKLFNMNGERYYTFKPRDGVRFFALDSNYMDKKQLEWLDKELASSGSDWKICFFHHPLYSAGETHGPDRQLRALLEPLFMKHGVHVVLTGHEHFYERIKPQNGIHYWIVGSSGKLRNADIKRDAQTAVGFDQDHAFMLVEIDKDRMHFQTVTRKGRIVDSGSIALPSSKNLKPLAHKAAAGNGSAP